MATVECRTCGRVWNGSPDGEGMFTASQFSTPSMYARGSYPSVDQLIASGENLLACPSDPQEPLDSAMQQNSSGSRSSARITGRSARNSRLLGRDDI